MEIREPIARMDTSARQSGGGDDKHVDGGGPGARTVGRDGRGQGQAEPHYTVIDTDRKTQLSRRGPNNEAELLQLLGDVMELAGGDPVTRAVDLNGGAVWWIALQFSHSQKLLRIPGRTVHHAPGDYLGSGKTGAKDTFVIAGTARMHRDLHPLQEIGEIDVNLRTLTARRIDLSANRPSAINGLRAQMLEYFPALERAFYYSESKSVLILLTEYQTPVVLRRIGRVRPATWPKNHGVCRGSRSKIAAAAAVTVAEAQFSAVPGAKTYSQSVRTLAREVTSLDQEVAELEALFGGRFREHPHAELISRVISSMLGIGDFLGAEFIAATGGDMAAFGSPNRLADVAGLAPGPRESGKISGNLSRSQWYSRRLLRMFCLTAQVATVYCPVSIAFHGSKRNEGNSRKQVILALVWRRLHGLWALRSDGRRLEAITPKAAATTP